MDKVFPEPARLGLTQGRNNLSHTSPDMRSRRQEEAGRGRDGSTRCSRKGREGLNPEHSGCIPHLQTSAHLQHLRGEEIPPGAGMDTRQGVPQAVLLRGRIPGYRQEY